MFTSHSEGLVLIKTLLKPLLLFLEYGGVGGWGGCRFYQLSAAYSRSAASHGITLLRMEQMDAGTVSKALWCHSTLYIQPHGAKAQQTLLQTTLIVLYETYIIVY